MKPWWSDFYDEHLSNVLLRTPSETLNDDTIAFLFDKLRIDETARVFDQCCGEGRLSIPLAERGVTVVGVDQSEPYIELAKRDAAELPADFYCDDAFKFLPDEPCDAAFNWWTSFGYAPTEEENSQMVRRAFEALKSNGVFALDFLNVPNIIAEFRPTVVNRVETEDGELILVRKTEFDFHRGEILKRWIYTLPDGTRLERPSVVQMYLPSDIVRIFQDVGFVDVELFGSVKGEALTRRSPRCIVVGVKP